MDSEDRKKFTLMASFIHNGKVSEDNLLRKFEKNLVNEALAKGYISKIGVNDLGINLYKLTKKGKELW